MNIIIGAGITGLSFAKFSKEKCLIIEKNKNIGGYCKTTKRNGFVWDYSGHFFHFRNQKIKDLISKNLSSSELVEVNKNTKIKYKDLLIEYPFQKNIHQLEKEEFIDCLFDLFSVEKKEYSNFEEMLYQKFGKSISEKFLIPYNEKLYACNLNKLDKDAMGRFFPYAEKEEIIQNFKNSNNSSYNGTFTYPKGGAIEYINSIHEGLNNTSISTNTNIVQINPQKQTILLSNNQELRYDNLISTIPFPHLLELCDIEYKKEIYTWNKVLVFNLGFNCKGKNKMSHWIYFPEKKYSFYRVGFYDNILNQDRMSLYVELGFSKDEEINPNEWIGRVLNDLKKADILSEEQILVDFESIIMDPAYVHITDESIQDVNDMKKHLAKNNIYSIGRYGSWTYCSIEDNITEAKTLAEIIS